MATTFDELLLDTDYTNDAEGGPEFVTAIVRAGQGGSTAYRSSNREDYVSRYTIDFSDMIPARQNALRQFNILREGMARGFRFLAPDDSMLNGEIAGFVNPATGEVEKLTTNDGSLTNFFLIKHYSDGFNSYTRRILKPSPYEEVLIELVDESDPQGAEYYSGTIPPGLAQGGALPHELSCIIPAIAPLNDFTATIGYFTGTLTITPALPAGYLPRVTCSYHLPVAFNDDWQNFKIDHGGVSALRVGLEELLPAELGLT